jgi:hypothetical protein
MTEEELEEPMAEEASNALEPPADQEPPVMENVSHIDRELYYEAVKGLSKGIKNKILSFLGVLIAVVGLLMASRVVLVLGLILAVGFILSPMIIGRRDYHKLTIIHPEGEWDKTVRFYEDRVETRSDCGTPTVVPYKNIRREVETEHLYILDFGKKAPSTMIRKDSFLTGSLEELKVFLLDQQRAAYNKKGED